MTGDAAAALLDEEGLTDWNMIRKHFCDSIIVQFVEYQKRESRGYVMAVHQRIESRTRIYKNRCKHGPNT